MLFRRRHDPGWLHRVRELVWPRAGWRRVGYYLIHRVRRLPGTPHGIAVGFACGAAISFTPFIGLHFALAALLTWSIGGNILASAIGTAVGNPWTFPFIWMWCYRLGSWMLGSGPVDLSADLSLSFIFDNPWRVLLPMFLGSLPTGVVAWIAFYWPVRRMVEGYHRRRLRRRERRRKGQASAAREAGS